MISTKSGLRAALRRGETVTIRGGGNSMVGRLNPGEELVLAAYSQDCILNLGSIVLARVRRRWCLHQIVAVDGDRVLIGDTKGYINGWTTLDQVIGVVVCVLAVPGLTPLRVPTDWGCVAGDRTCGSLRARGIELPWCSTGDPVLTAGKSDRAPPTHADGRFIDSVSGI